MPIKHYLYRMCLLNNSLHFGIEIKAVLEGRGFRPNFLGKNREEIIKAIAKIRQSVVTPT
jgi:hypothetical protein